MLNVTNLLARIAVVSLVALSGCMAEGPEGEPAGEPSTAPAAEEVVSSGQALKIDDHVWGGWNQGGGVALGRFDGDSRPDLVFVRADAPDKDNSLFYRVGFNVGTDGMPTSYGPMVQVPGGIGYTTSGAGVSVADINGNGKQDLVVVYVDAPNGTDATRYRIGWDMSASGTVSSWSEIRSFAGGFHGNSTAGADVVVRDVDNNGKLDVIIATVDDPSSDNVVYWSVGYDLNSDGYFTGANSPTRSKPGGIGWRTADLGLSVADMNRDNIPDLVFSWIDDAGGQDVHYVQIGYGLDAQGNVKNWGPVRTLPGDLTNITHAAGIVAHDFNNDGSIDILAAALSYNGSGDYLSLNLADNRSDRGNYAFQFKPDQKCLASNGSTNLVEATCNSASASQSWIVASMGDGWYSLINKANNKCAGIEGGSTEIWSPNLEQQDCNGSPAQQFKFLDGGKGYTWLQIKVSNLCVETFYPSTAWLTQYDCIANDNSLRITPLPLN